VVALSAEPSRSPVLKILGAFALVALSLLGAAVKVALFPRHRTGGAMAVIWGVAFAAYLWWGSHQIGLGQSRAILLGVVGGAACALFIYLRGAGLDRPPAYRPGAFLRRRAARKHARPDELAR
jgi:hypothetical protein